MAENLDGWVTKQQIRAKFKGSDSVLDSAIKALRDRKIIHPKEGEKAFAAWIRYYTADPEAVERSIASESGAGEGEA